MAKKKIEVVEGGWVDDYKFLVSHLLCGDGLDVYRLGRIAFGNGEDSFDPSQQTLFHEILRKDVIQKDGKISVVLGKEDAVGERVSEIGVFSVNNVHMAARFLIAPIEKKAEDEYELILSIGQGAIQKLLLGIDSGKHVIKQVAFRSGDQELGRKPVTYHAFADRSSFQVGFSLEEADNIDPLAVDQVVLITALGEALTRVSTEIQGSSNTDGQRTVFRVLVKL